MLGKGRESVMASGRMYTTIRLSSSIGLVRLNLQSDYHLQSGYYLRRNADGFIENSTCVSNTASEHFMVDCLIVDDLLNRARNYKVDGFQFDLMGHMLKSTMMRATSLLRNLSRDKDEVDGSSIFMVMNALDDELISQDDPRTAEEGAVFGKIKDAIRQQCVGQIV